MRLCHNHVTEYEVISNLGSFCFSKHHHHPRRSWEGTAHLVVLKNQAKLLLTTMLFTLQTVSIYRMSVINMFFERMIFSGFSAILFLIFLLPTYLSYLLNLQNHNQARRSIHEITASSYWEDLSFNDVQKPLFFSFSHLTQKFPLPWGHNNSLHHHTTIYHRRERMRRLPNWDRTMTKCLDVDPISVVWHHWLLQIRNFRNWFTATVGWPWFSTDLRVKTIGMII